MEARDRRIVRIAGMAALLLAAGGCIWPLRSRTMEFREGDAQARSYVLERCRGTLAHPVVRGHCLTFTVRRELVAPGRELVFPGDGADAVVSSVFIRPSTRAPARGRMTIREVTADRVVADVDATGTVGDGTTFVVRDRVAFRALKPGERAGLHP
jgi:hypothetical protein